jgi:hypothetical protein
MVYNGETGHKSFGWQMFLFRNVCCNFNIWDLSEGRTKRVRHTKSVRDAFEVFKEDCKNLSGALSDQEYSFLAKAARPSLPKKTKTRSSGSTALASQTPTRGPASKPRTSTSTGATSPCGPW